MRRAPGLALALLVTLASLGVAQQFSGVWDFDVDINPQEAALSDALSMESFVRVEYKVSDWTFASLSRFSESGWGDQDFAVAGRLGLFTFSSAVDFSPAVPSFGSLITTVTVPIDEVTFTSRFRLQGGNTFLTLTGRGSSGSVALTARVDLGEVNGVCDFPFKRAVLGVGFPLCCLTVASSITFSDSGFDLVTFRATRITVPEIPWIMMSVQLAFTVQTKSVTISPTLNIPTTPCVDIYASLDGEGLLALWPIRIDGFRLVCTFGTVTFTAISYWGDGVKPGVLADTEYWEAYVIESKDDGCCGPVTFDVAVFFIENGIRLFDVALFRANVEIALADQFTFSTGIDVDTELGGITSWRLGFAISW